MSTIANKKNRPVPLKNSKIFMKQFLFGANVDDFGRIGS